MGELAAPRNDINPQLRNSNVWVSDLISEEGSWKVNRIWNLFTPLYARQILASSILYDENVNTCRKGTKNGIYSTKSGYWNLKKNLLFRFEKIPSPHLGSGKSYGRVNSCQDGKCSFGRSYTKFYPQQLIYRKGDSQFLRIVHFEGISKKTNHTYSEIAHLQR